jgi:hypothetical protein
MPSPFLLEPVDYLVIGIAHDRRQMVRLGGTVSCSALTAALGCVGVLTASGPEASLRILKDIPVISAESPQSTTFENIYTEGGRIQFLRAQAPSIDFNSVPETWRHTPIIHLGPIANEMDSVLPAGFSSTLLGLTPQGWMRQCDDKCHVSHRLWTDAELRQGGGCSHHQPRRWK